MWFWLFTQFGFFPEASSTALLLKGVFISHNVLFLSLALVHPEGG